MLARTRSTVRVGWWGTVLAVLLAVVVPANATAAEPEVISGSVQLPPGESLEGLYALAYEPASPGWRLVQRAYLDGDGRFRFDGTLEASEYRLELSCASCRFTTGYYAGPGKPLVPFAAQGVSVAPGTGGINLVSELGDTISGALSLPADFEFADRGVEIRASEFLEGKFVGSSLATVYARDPGTFTFHGLRPGARFVLYVQDGPFSPGFPAGYFHVDGGLVDVSGDGTPVRPGASGVRITVGTERIAGSLTSLVAPSISGDVRAGVPLTASPGDWSMLEVDLAYQWFRDGQRVPGATGVRLTPSTSDVGARFAVRVTAFREGHAKVAVTSSATAPVAALRAPRATTSPAVSGTARLGSTLRVSPGAWSVSGATFAYQWLRAGKAIKGATKRTYKLKKSDVGKRVSVRVTASKAGYDDGVASSSAKKVAKAKSKVTAKTKSVKVGKRAKVTVRVKVAGLKKPAGTITLKYGKKKVKVKVKAKHAGKVTVRLPKLAKGRYKLVASFKPSGSTARYATSAKSKKVTLRVR